MIVRACIPLGAYRHAIKPKVFAKARSALRQLRGQSRHIVCSECDRVRRVGWQDCRRVTAKLGRRRDCSLVPTHREALASLGSDPIRQLIQYALTDGNELVHVQGASAVSVNGRMTNATTIRTAARAAKFCRFGIKCSSRRRSGAKTIASTAAQRTAPKKGRRNPGKGKRCGDDEQ
jgi:hypothetical protein